MTRDELLRALVAASARLQSLREEARRHDPEVSAAILKAGEEVAKAIGILHVKARKAS